MSRSKIGSSTCRGLHRPVAHRRYAQRTQFLAAQFRYPDPAGRVRLVFALAQFFPQPYHFLYVVRFKLLHRLSIHSGCAPVASDGVVAVQQTALRTQLVPEAEPLGCRLALFEPG
jgi:hypothetical protein